MITQGQTDLQTRGREGTEQGTQRGSAKARREPGVHCCLHEQDDFFKAFLESNEEVGAMTEGAGTFAELSL